MRDERGSIVSVANSSGTIIAINSYDEYGNPASTNQGRFGYTGQMWLPDIAMYYYRARIYAPSLGRFLQTDPIGYADGMNLYAYVGNDPINYVDPLGLNACSTRKESMIGCFVVNPPSGETNGPDITVNGRRFEPLPPWGYGTIVVWNASDLIPVDFSIGEDNCSDCIIVNAPELSECDGPRLNIGINAAVTAFLFFGKQTTFEIGVSIPLDPREGYGQGYLTTSSSSLRGVGGYVGAGPGISVSAQEGVMRSGRGSSWGAQVGAAWGRGAEASISVPQFPSRYGGWGAGTGLRPSLGVGAYLAQFRSETRTYATPVFHCPSSF